PANTTLVSYTPPANWTCTNTAGVISCKLNSGQTLAVGAVVYFPLVVTVNVSTPAGTTITNIPNITSSVGDPNLGNNTVTVSTIVALPTQSSVSITKTATPEPVNQGAILTYVVTVTNGGPAVATGAFTVTDPLPPEVTYIPGSFSTTNGTCSGSTAAVTCTLNDLAVGSSAVITINVTASTFSANSLSTNTAELTTTSSVSNVPTSLGTATAATWSAGVPSNFVSFTFLTPLPLGANSLLTTTGFTPAAYNVTNAPVLSVNPMTGVVTVAMATNPGTSTALGTATTNYPLYANAISTIQAPTAVDVSSFHAFSQSDGSVILEWRTHEESRNLGFHVYRENSTGRTRIDPSLIAGSALLLRGGRPQHAAKIYRWIDPHPVRDAAYWIEDVDINGTRSTHGPAYLESPSVEVAATLASATPSALLSSQRASVVSLSLANPSPALVVPRPILPILPLGLPRLSVADHHAVKISVAKEGWYRISFAQLFAAGLDRNADSRSLHLYAEGVEQPLLLAGRASGPLSPTDTIEFYGTGIDTPFSAERVYWLIIDNHWPKRILPAAAPLSGSTAPASFPFAVLREDRSTYFAALLNGENNDNFFGAIITSEPTDQDLVVAHINSSSALPISLDVALQGVTDAQEHGVTVQFNGATLGEMDFLGLALAQQSFPVEPSLLRNGTNTVTLTALNGDNDVSLVQSIALHYAHTYAADADWLRATAFAGSELHLTGFTNPQIRVFDITDPLNISELAAKISRESGAYSSALALSTGGPAVRTILAFANDAISTPLAVAPHVPTFLDDQRTGADFVIITHPDFVASLAPLVRLRESQGHHISLVTTDEIFDEYNYGERSPFAIRSFLQAAASRWQRKPQSILFVGDASFDPRDYLGLGDFDLVPTRIIETAAFKTASDDWFTDFLQNGFATIPTGRLPVRTPADADLVVSKIIGYERGNSAGSWNSQALLIADQNIDSNFTAAANSARAALPPALQVSEILADSLDSVTARSQILAALNNGALLVDYSGHGAEQQWSFANLFDTTDATALSNGGRLPVYLLMDCLNGFFHDVYGESLAESLLLAPNGGAVAVWASSGFTQQSPQSTMNQAFLHLFAGNPNQPLGRLVFQAKAGTTDIDVRRTWILFGDPAMKIQFAPTSIPGRTSAPVSKPVIPPVSRRPCLPVSACSKEKQRQ
ncbi:MAG: C25 family cysteine peptidase, partial [Candidatus Acidiferrales bacterium]